MRTAPELGAIDAAALTSAPLARAETIPSAWYSDPRFHAIDSELVFARTWQNVGHVAQVAAEGQHLVATVADDPVIVVRGRDGVLRAFFNVCRHRGGPLALEDGANVRHEFLDGEIYAMAGGSEEHSALAGRMIVALTAAVGDRPCHVHTSDLRLYVEAGGLATYPDCSVICGPLRQHEPSPRSTALNPMILVEVTSDSSEEYDRGAKLGYYQTIPTLRDYVIVSHRERQITVHTREAGGSWTTRSAGKGELVSVASIEADLAVDDIYRNIAVP
jgi:Uma2 family endonuclease